MYLELLSVVDFILDTLLRFEVDCCEGRLRVGQYKTRWFA